MSHFDVACESCARRKALDRGLINGSAISLLLWGFILGALIWAL